MRFYQEVGVFEAQKVEECLLVERQKVQVLKREDGIRYFGLGFIMGRRGGSLLYSSLSLNLRVYSRRTSIQRVLESLGFIVGFLGDFALVLIFFSQMLAKVCPFLWTKDDLFLACRFHLLLCSVSRMICRYDETLCRKLVYCFFFQELSSVCLMPSSFSLSINSRSLSLYFCNRPKTLRFCCFSTQFSFQSYILSKRPFRLQWLLFFKFSLFHSFSLYKSPSMPWISGLSNTNRRFLQSEKCLVSGYFPVPRGRFSQGLMVVVSFSFQSLILS